MKETFEINARVTQKIWDLLDRLDLQELERLMHQEDYMKTWRFIEENLLPLG